MKRPLRCHFERHRGEWHPFVVCETRRNHPDGLESRRYETREWRLCEDCREYQERLICEGILPPMESERRKAKHRPAKAEPNVTPIRREA